MRTHNSICEICNKSFYAGPSAKAKGYGRFCSSPCHMAARKAASGSEIPCEHCGQTFFANHCDRTKGHGRFCSVPCMLSHRKIDRTANALCLHCGTPFYANSTNLRYGWGKYCSRHCSDAHQTVLAQSFEKISKRFWKKVMKTEGCWLWIGGKNKQGYGTFSLRGVPESTHRVSYELEHGVAPGALKVLHSCDNPACVRPEHLSLGTQAENLADMRNKNRHAYGDNHGNSKLTVAKVIEIRQRYALGEISQEALGAEYGVASSTIANVISRKNWKHVH